jgi:hypothetical protein
MRCHLDRPGVADALERDDPHPYTYVCAACHDEVLGEFAPDLAAQIDRWPRVVREYVREFFSVSWTWHNW